MASSKTNLAVSFAEHYLGTPYSWGGGGPTGPSRGFAQGAGTIGFDCSSLVQGAMAAEGVNIGRTTFTQFKQGTPVGPNQLQPGDAVFFKGSDSQGGLPGHVALYIGGGKIIQAPHTGGQVEVTNLTDMGGFMGARRYAPGGGGVAAASAYQTVGAPAKPTSPVSTGVTPDGSIIAPQVEKQHIVTQRVQALSGGLSSSLLANANALLSGQKPDLSGMFTLAKGFQQARAAIVKTPPLGGTGLAQTAGGQV